MYSRWAMVKEFNVTSFMLRNIKIYSRIKPLLIHQKHSPFPKLCHVSGTQSPTCCCGKPGSILGQAMCKFGWKVWHWGNYFLRVLWFSSVTTISPMLYILCLFLFHRGRITLATVSVDVQYASLFLKIFPTNIYFQNVEICKIFKFSLCLIKHCVLDAYEEEEV
jgi:hypothetical protein